MFKNNYNSIAHLYDSINNIVFLKQSVKAQEDLIHSLPDEGHLLFIGGGTGTTLQKIENLKPQINITYIEASSRMVELSKKKSTNPNTVFIRGGIANIPDQQYDIVCTFFFLDLFEQPEIEMLFNQLHSHLKVNGIWLYADFNVSKKWWQKGIEFTMFQFLKFTTQITSSRIGDYSFLFKKNGYFLLTKHYYYGGFIANAVYKKREY